MRRSYSLASAAAAREPLELHVRAVEGGAMSDYWFNLAKDNDLLRLRGPLGTFFLRDACERLGKPDVHLSTATLDLFARYWWPGNVRQLRNEIQRAVALSPPGGAIDPDHLSPDLSAPEPGTAATAGLPSAAPIRPGNLANVVERVERDLITATLSSTAGNISETARVLGLTRRGLYLKMRRLGLEATMADTQ